MFPTNNAQPNSTKNVCFYFIDLQDIGPQLRHFILADAPTFNTVKDFWRMTWSQNSTYIVYSTAVDESAIPLFPKQMHREQTFGDYTVSVLIEHHHLYVIERRIRLTSNELNQSREVIFIQPKQWPAKKYVYLWFFIYNLSHFLTDNFFYHFCCCYLVQLQI